MPENVVTMPHEPQELKLNDPWLVAVWPGMGNVAVSGGYYLMAKMGMHFLAEFAAREMFDVEYIEVQGGLITTGRLPRSRLFVWPDPAGKRDIIVFIGEAQPPTGKYAFCQRLIDFAKQLGVRRVFTFAAMATQMHPEQPSRVFGAATDEERLKELTQLELELVEDGHIGGLNGVLLAAAAEQGLTGTCLLGEMPHIFAQLPFPKASLAVLEVFTTIAGIKIDFTELSEQATAMEQRLNELLATVERRLQQQMPAEEESFEETLGIESDPDALRPEDEQLIEDLFAQAEEDRSKAYELKRQLDRFDVFSDYEDRFLDLFRKPE